MQYLQELPLVFFTLLAQMAIGIVLVGQCITGCGGDNATRDRVRLQSIPAMLLFGIAALISFIHTGTPLHGPFTLLNIGSSWLSREIALVMITGAALLLLAFLRFRKPYSPKERPAAAAVIIAGIALVFAMSGVYNRDSMPGWHSPGVFPLFLSSMLMLGALWHALALSLKNEAVRAASACAARAVIICSLAGFILAAACLPLALPDRSISLNTAAVLLPYACLAWSHAAHALLSGLGALLIVLAALRASRSGGFHPAFTLPAFVLLLSGEILGRLVFYLSYSRFGM
jgi:anaerobic dimethyl sulfoxide reductase subunit C (anchor subunit)